MTLTALDSSNSVSVCIPTRNRPDRLRTCLQHAVAACNELDRPAEIVVADSSAEDNAEAVREVVSEFAIARLVPHDLSGVAAARNVAFAAAIGDLFVNVDDDVYVHRDCFRTLVREYEQGEALAVVAGSVCWGEDWSTPVIHRFHGFGRKADPEEAASFLLGALFIVPKQVAKGVPFHEAIRTSDDRMWGAQLRAAGVALRWTPDAKALHDHQHTAYGIEHVRWHAYAHLFDTVVANPSLLRFIGHDLVGALFWMKRVIREQPGQLPQFVRNWTAGHRMFFRDFSRLRAMVKRQRLAVDPLRSAGMSHPSCISAS